MAKTSYRVIPRDDSGFDVEMDKQNGPSRTVPGFRSEHEANAWIVQAKRMIRDAGPWTALAPRNPAVKITHDSPKAPTHPEVEQKRLQAARNTAATRRALVRAIDER